MSDELEKALASLRSYLARAPRIPSQRQPPDSDHTPARQTPAPTPGDDREDEA